MFAISIVRMCAVCDTSSSITRFSPLVSLASHANALICHPGAARGTAGWRGNSPHFPMQITPVVRGYGRGTNGGHRTRDYARRIFVGRYLVGMRNLIKRVCDRFLIGFYGNLVSNQSGQTYNMF